MEENLKDSFFKIRKRAQGFLHGKMVASMMVNGKMESSMESVSILQHQKKVKYNKLEKAFGITVKEPVGSHKNHHKTSLQKTKD